MALLLLLIFIVVPLAELYVIIQVGQAIGVWWTILLLLVDSIVGAALMRSQGRAAWRRFQLAMQEGRMPHREVVDGALVIFGGAFLLTPGFITDIFGFVLLLPPTRALVRAFIVRGVGRRFAIYVTGARTVAGRDWRDRGEPPPSWDVEGTAYENDPGPPPQLER